MPIGCPAAPGCAQDVASGACCLRISMPTGVQPCVRSGCEIEYRHSGSKSSNMSSAVHMSLKSSCFDVVPVAMFLC